MTTPIRSKIGQRNFYKILLTASFAINTGHRYHSALRLLLYIYVFDLFVVIILPTSFKIVLEKNTMTVADLLEQIQYIVAGWLFCLTYVILIWKKKAIATSYCLIETDFVQWSRRRGTNPDLAYEKCVQTFKIFVTPCVFISICVFFGPLLAAVNDLGTVPLDDRSHFTMFWPKFVEIDEFTTYAILYSVQIMFAIFVNTSIVVFNFGLMVILNELNGQFELLLKEIKETFSYRTEKTFEKRLIDCILHHQTIIRFVNVFKSYFKWIIFIEIIAMQGVLAIGIYILTKVDAPYGYKAKIVGVLCFNAGPLCFHCHIGEIVLNMHKRLAEQMYDSAWYDMPNKNKHLIVIMFQRTQKHLSLNSAIFSAELLSRSLISRIGQQVYRIWNVLLKT